MSEDLFSYLETYEEETRERFHILYQLIYKSTSCTINEKLWTKLPSFYVEDHFIRLIPFKDHINIEAKAVLSHREKLSNYKITPKGMLQIFHYEQVPYELLKIIFKESLE